MKLFTVIATLVVIIGAMVGGVVSLLEPGLAGSVTIGFFFSLLTSLVS